MEHFCRFCQKVFNRSYNRDRHEKQNCPKRFVGEQDDNPYATEEAEKTMQDEENEDSIGEEPVDEEEDDDGEEEEEEDKEMDMEDESISSDGDSEANPWEKLIEEVVNDLNSHWEEQITIHMYQGASRERAEAETFNALLPAFRKRLRYVYLDHLKWFHSLKMDSIHRNVMKTIRKFMKEEDMDFEEAAEAAINKRKYLLNKIFKQKKVREEPSTVDVRDYYSRKWFPYNNGYSK